MCGGGGYSAPPDNSVELERMRQAENERLRLLQEEKDARDRAERESKFRTGLTSAQSLGRNVAERVFRQRQLDPNSYSSLIDQGINETTAMVPDLDPNPSQYFSPSVFENLLNQEQQSMRTRYTRDIGSLFSPGYEQDIITDTMDDPFINKVLSNQRNNVQLQIDRAKARGNLDDRGYTAAQGKLDELFKSGMSTGQALGRNVLEGYRQSLRDIAGNAKQAAGSFELGSTFNPNIYTAQRDRRIADIKSNLEGDITGALSGQNFFDIGDILTQGGITQGAVNPRLSLASVLAARNERQEAPRGLGGKGTF